MNDDFEIDDSNILIISKHKGLFHQNQQKYVLIDTLYVPFDDEGNVILQNLKSMPDKNDNLIKLMANIESIADITEDGNILFGETLPLPNDAVNAIENEAQLADADQVEQDEEVEVADAEQVEEVEVADAEQVEVVEVADAEQVEEVEVADAEQVEEVEVADAEQAEQVEQDEEVEVADAEQVEQDEEVEVTDAEQVEVADAEDAEVADAEQVEQDEEVEVTDSEVVEVADAEDAEVADAEDAEVADVEDAEVAEVEEADADADAEADDDDDDDDDDDEFDLEFDVVGQAQIIKGSIASKMVLDTRLVAYLLESDNLEYLSKQRSSIINLVNLVNKQLDSNTIGKLLIRHRGLPKWMIPIVSVTVNKLDRVDDQLEEVVYTTNSLADGCNLVPDIPFELTLRADNMDTDKEDDPAGAHLRERSDYTIPVVLKTDLSKLTQDFITNRHIAKFKGLSYSSHVNLIQAARNKLLNLENKDKASHLYTRFLTMPGYVRGLETKNTYKTNINVAGFIIRPIESALSSRLKKGVVIPMDNCDAREDNTLHMESFIDNMYPSIDQLIMKHKDYISRCLNFLPIEHLFKLYKYELKDLSPDQIRLIESIMPVKDLKKDKTWSKVHTQKVLSTDKRSHKPREINPLFDVDSGLYHYCNLLNEYMKNLNKDVLTYDLLPSPEGQDFPVYYDSGHVHKNTSYFKYNSRWYTKEDYNILLKNQAKQLYNQLSAEYQNVKADPAKLQSKCKDLGYSRKRIKETRDKLMQGIIAKLAIDLNQVKYTVSPYIDMLHRFDLTNDQDKIGFRINLDVLLEQGIAKEADRFFILTNTGEIICCKHVYYVDILAREVDAYINEEGTCRYCGVTIEEQEQKNDYNQYQQSSLREMYIKFDNSNSDDNKKRPLEVLIFIIIKSLNENLSRYKISNTDIQYLINKIIKHIEANHPNLVDPYNTFNLPSPSIASGAGNFVSDYLIYKTKSIKSTPKIVGILSGKVVGAVMDFMKKETGIIFSSNIMNNGKEVPYINFLMKQNKKLTSKLDEPETLFNIAMSKSLVRTFGIVMAYVASHLDIDYQELTFDKVSETVNGVPFMYGVFNEYHQAMSKIIGDHIKTLNVVATSNQQANNFQLMQNLFKGEFNYEILFKLKILHNIDLWADALTEYENAYNQLVRENSDFYNLLNNDGIDNTFSYENYNGLVTRWDSEPAKPRQILTVIDQLKCLSNLMYRSGYYFSQLWKHYAVVTDNLDNVEIKPTWTVTDQEQDKFYLADMFGQELKGTNFTNTELPEGQTCFYDAMAFSINLLENDLRTGNSTEIVDNYYSNKDTLKKYVDNISQIDRVLSEGKVDNSENCKMMDISSFKNQGLKPYQSYRHNTFTKKSDFRITGQLQKEDLTPDYKNNLLTRFKNLITFKNTETNVDIDDRLTNLFAKYNNLFTSLISDASRKILTDDNELAMKAVDRQSITYFSANQIPEHLAQLAEFGFSSEEWPTPTKNVDTFKDVEKRKIIRQQQLGIMIKKYLSWINAPLDETEKEWVPAEDLPITANQKFDKEIVDVNGYILPELMEIRKRKDLKTFKLSSFNSYVPELYKMSYYEFIKYVTDNDLIDEVNNTSLQGYSDILTASLKFDLLLHYKLVIRNTLDPDAYINVQNTLKFDSFNITTGDTIEDYVILLDSLFKAIYTPEILDPIRQHIVEIYSVRTLNNLSKRMLNKDNVQKITGFVSTETKEINIMDDEEPDGNEGNDDRDDNDSGEVETNEQEADELELIEGIENEFQG